MARIAGINLPPNKRIAVGLTYIFGIGNSLAGKILEVAQIDPLVRVADLSPQEVGRLKAIIEKNYKVEGELRSRVFSDIKRLKDINCYRGARHSGHLPARGQRTKTNTRTVRGNVRRTTLSGRKPTAKKV